MGKRFMRQGDNWVRMAAMKMLCLAKQSWVAVGGSAWLVHYFETMREGSEKV
jgi:hypothetical protein